MSKDYMDKPLPLQRPEMYVIAAIIAVSAISIATVGRVAEVREAARVREMGLKVYYTVKPQGDTGLFKIANRYGLIGNDNKWRWHAEAMRLNGWKNDHAIHAGERIVLPDWRTDARRRADDMVGAGKEAP